MSFSIFPKKKVWEGAAKTKKKPKKKQIEKKRGETRSGLTNAFCGVGETATTSLWDEEWSDVHGIHVRGWDEEVGGDVRFLRFCVCLCREEMVMVTRGVVVHNPGVFSSLLGRSHYKHLQDDCGLLLIAFNTKQTIQTIDRKKNARSSFVLRCLRLCKALQPPWVELWVGNSRDYVSSRVSSRRSGGGIDKESGGIFDLPSMLPHLA